MRLNTFFSSTATHHRNICCDCPDTSLNTSVKSIMSCIQYVRTKRFTCFCLYWNNSCTVHVVSTAIAEAIWTPTRYIIHTWKVHLQWTRIRQKDEGRIDSTAEDEGRKCVAVNEPMHARRKQKTVKVSRSSLDPSAAHHRKIQRRPSLQCKNIEPAWSNGT